MATEAQMVTAVKVVLPRLYPDFAGATDSTTLPYGTFQQVGGEAPNFLGGGVGGRRNARIQFNVWASTTAQAKSLMKQIEDVVKASPFFADAIGAMQTRQEPTTKLRGAQQDFSFWLT